LEFVAVFLAEALHLLGALVVVGLDVDNDSAAVLAVGEAPVFARAPEEKYGP
jgi:hypothetical protein